MKPVTIRLDDEVMSRLEALSEAHGINPEDLVREAIIERLEELEDFYAVDARMKEAFRPIGNDEAWSRLGFKKDPTGSLKDIAITGLPTPTLIPSPQGGGRHRKYVGSLPSRWPTRGDERARDRRLGPAQQIRELAFLDTGGGDDGLGAAVDV